MTTKPRRWPRVSAGVVSALALTATGVAGVGGLAYRNIDNNITASQAYGPATASNPSYEAGKPLNVLIMGSDTREGQSDEGIYGDASIYEGARSDTTILLHIAADRSNAFAVSIPRDTLVNIPSCTQPDGTASKPRKEVRFNEAFSIGGESCTIKTVEQLTGVPVNHYVVVDFTGFKDVVDALDGVEVCLKEPVDDEMSGLKLPAGVSTVRGEDALAFVRARYTLGDGSDISRISRQQAFISSAIRKATSSQTLSNPLTAYRVLDQATKTLSTDPGLASLPNLQALALSMSDLSPSEIVFLTAPISYNNDGATVSLVQPEADKIWRAMIDDTGWPPPATVPPGDTEPLRAAPEEVKVTVYNGTATSGRAQVVGTELSKAGYQVLGTMGYDGANLTTTQVRYAPGQFQQARTIAYAMGTTDIQEDANVARDTVSVIVGSDYRTLLPVIAEPLVVVDPNVPTPSSTPTPSGSPAWETPSMGQRADVIECV